MNMTYEETTKYFLQYGIKEKRIYNKNLFKYFDIKNYKKKE